ncbi:MAG: GH36 C-terminal domain-containing protein, partial [Muribaculaceae bacterium]|nr:GH36 C-terminal domain-containing protein [Muribaculaceae bacterium]
MTAGEKSMCRRAIEEYKKVRDVIQLGDLYRLLSPYDDKGVASLLYASAGKDEAVFFWWKTRAFFADQLPRVKMDGLDPDRHYRVMELNRIDKKPLRFEGKVYSGRFLMDTGLEIPLAHDLDKADRTPWSSRILHLVAEP